MEIGGALQVHRNLVLRHTHELVNEYVWNFITTGIIRGVSVGTSTKQRKFILLEQESNGIHCGYCRVKHSALSYHGRLQDYSPAPGSTKYCLLRSPVTTQDSVGCTRLRREQERSIGDKEATISVVSRLKKCVVTEFVEATDRSTIKRLASRGNKPDACTNLGTRQ